MKRTYESLAEEQRREKHKEELASDLEIAASDDEETNTPAAGEPLIPRAIRKFDCYKFRLIFITVYLQTSDGVTSAPSTTARISTNEATSTDVHDHFLV